MDYVKHLYQSESYVGFIGLLVLNGIGVLGALNYVEFTTLVAMNYHIYLSVHARTRASMLSSHYIATPKPPVVGAIDNKKMPTD